MGFQIQICSILLLVDFAKVLCLSANEPQQNSNASSREDYIPQILTVLLEFCHLTFVTFCLLSLLRKQQLKQCNYSVDQSALLTGFRTDFSSSVWISVAESQTLFLAKRPQRRSLPRTRFQGSSDFVRDEIRTPLKTPAWEAISGEERGQKAVFAGYIVCRTKTIRNAKESRSQIQVVKIQWSLSLKKLGLQSVTSQVG